jgi:hypothetical protein
VAAAVALAFWLVVDREGWVSTLLKKEKHIPYSAKLPIRRTFSLSPRPHAPTWAATAWAVVRPSVVRFVVRHS